ncbi:DNA-binding transcriptional MerR regulator [Labedella gwakjiensis]|uniref:DNA-binding transcriptional MerR regulator n=2 Tax=Labedella gwakjiensis TaxID=390269 RepID=A0A2P8GVZ8_9MICO|nr:DNA-binding transcriptional MerR regulator [Labedella gwakjiensis]
MGTMTDETDDEELTVGRAATRLGVTVRALHHWDEIGLAQPSSRSIAGYRLYTGSDIERLSRIIVYRELGLDLEAIGSVLDDPDTDVVAALEAQRAGLAERIEHLSSLSVSLDRMIEAHTRGLLLTEDEQRAALGPGWDPQWPAEARRRYGDTTPWRQYAERSASRTPADWQAVAETNAAFERALAEAMEAGIAPGSPEANALVERHREVFSAYFPVSRSMQVVLGRMYEADPAYAAHYDGVRPGLASWLRRVIDAGARAHGIDPDTATWEDDATTDDRSGCGHAAIG